MKDGDKIQSLQAEIKELNLQVLDKTAQIRTIEIADEMKWCRNGILCYTEGHKHIFEAAQKYLNNHNITYTYEEKQIKKERYGGPYDDELFTWEVTEIKHHFVQPRP